MIRPKARALVRGEAWDAEPGAAWVRFWNSRARLRYDIGDCAVYELDSPARKAAAAPDLPGPQEWLAVRWQQDADPAGYAARYRRAISSGIESAGIHADFGLAMAGIGRDSDAELAFAKALAIAPELPGLWFMLARLRLEAGRVWAAREAFERGSSLDPYSPEAFDLPRRLKEAEAAVSGPAPDKLVR